MRKGLLILILLTTVLLCSCSKVFLNEDTMYTPKRYTISDLANKTYYVKDGSSFFALYTPTKSGATYVVDRDLETIPDFYGDEAIVLCTQQTTAKNLSLDRYSDEGYSLGIQGIKVNGDGNYEFTQGDTVKKTSAYDICKRCPSPNFVIETINGHSCSDYKLSNGGTIQGFQEGEEVALTMYSGSSYIEISMTVDTHFFAWYEDMDMQTPILTKLGYFAYTMPSEAKSGYYFLSGAGFFRYHNHSKGSCTAGGDDLNIPTYETLELELASRFTQYSVIVSAKNYDVKFDVSFDKESVDENKVRCIMQSPNGETYNMTIEDGVASLTLTEINAGKWTINLYPKGIAGVNVNVSSARVENESQCSEYVFDVATDIPLAVFKVIYSGQGEVWGSIENMNTGESKIIDGKDAGSAKQENTTITCDWAYLPSGRYRMRVYHYNDTAILSGTLSERKDGYDTEILVIE